MIRNRPLGGLGACLILALGTQIVSADDFHDHPSLREGDYVIEGFEFASGEHLDLRLHYTTLGRAVRDERGIVRNAVLILHGTTGHGQGFLTERFAGHLFGPGQLLDVEKFYVVLPDGIGHGGSSRPSDGPHMRFPAYDYDDMVRAQYRLLTEHLGVDHLRLVMGTSMGGMHTWVWGYTYPDFMDALMPLASEPVEIAGRNRMMRKMIIDAIKDDPGWQGGEYETQPYGLTAAVHTLIFMVSSPLEWQKEAPTREAAEAFLEDRVETYAGALDANDVIYQFDASRDYDPSPHLGEIQAPLLAVNSADDQVNPPELGILERQIAKVPHGRAVVLPITDETRGHGTHSLPAIWGKYLRELLEETEPGGGGRFVLEEATIAEIHRAMTEGRLTARRLVERYLARIAAYDKQGPFLNAIITINPRALERADELDAAFRESRRLTGPLHGIPVIVKDNYDTADLPTTAGSLSLADSIPPDDAFQVRKIRDAGAIVLAKSNMAEFAFSPYETVGSALPGYTRNPYDTKRVTAGSSGGTAAAVAANLGAVGLGTDTGNSIRGPSSHNLLVGIRSTMGLTSRDGIVPLYLDHDVGGPIARTVADAVAVLDVIAGYDPADPVTEASRDRPPVRYVDHLDPAGLAGARLGVVRQLADAETGDPEVHQRFEEALADLRAQGAILVDPVVIEELDTIPRDERWCRRFQYDLDNYLAGLGDKVPYKSLAEIEESGKFHPSVARGISYFRRFTGPPEEDETCRKAWANGKLLAAGIREVLAGHHLDAIVYPTWSNPPRLIGDLNTPAGDNSQDLSPHTGFPAITVPMGFVGEGLPVGLTILGDAWTEARLIEIAYAYEQATHHRRPPASTPPL